VWVSPEKFSFETHPDLIREELENAVVDERQIVAFDDDGTPKYSPADTIYAEIYAEVRAVQRASKNNLRENFCELRRRNGWEIVEVERDVQAAKAGLEIIGRGEELLSEDKARKVCAARELKVDEYDDLRRQDEQGTLSEADAFALRRYEVESFYLQAVSQEVLDLDDDGRFRKAVRLYEALLDTEEPEGEWKRNRLRADVLESAQRRELLRALFASAAIFTDANGFVTDAVVTQGDLPNFIAKCESKRVAIERLLDMSLRSDLRRKPVQQLGAFLKLVGLTLTGVGTRKQGKEKLYLYSINSDALARIESIAARRADESVREEWKRARSETEDGPDDFAEAVRRLRDRGRTATQDEAVDDA
jgi:cyanate lyase